MYSLAVEGLKPGDSFIDSWLGCYKVLTTDHTGSQKVVTLEVQNICGKIVTKKYKLNTIIHITRGPTFEWRDKIELRKKRYGDNYCKHCGHQFY